mmetsp:Transcript_82039/g.220307  ORF Transcript_82039/g.220307 Transcript_82039/m.220307 type:complete len:232 (+) Transcript_82039:219-914(+)
MTSRSDLRQPSSSCMRSSSLAVAARIASTWARAWRIWKRHWTSRACTSASRSMRSTSICALTRATASSCSFCSARRVSSSSRACASSVSRHWTRAACSCWCRFPAFTLSNINTSSSRVSTGKKYNAFSSCKSRLTISLSSVNLALYSRASKRELLITLAFRTSCSRANRSRSIRSNFSLCSSILDLSGAICLFMLDIFPNVVKTASTTTLSNASVDTGSLNSDTSSVVESI